MSMIRQSLRRSLSLGITSCFVIGLSSAAWSVDHSAWDALLKDAVKEGWVDYGKIRDRYPELQAYVGSLETVDLESLSDKERLALYINAYNAHSIRGVIDRGEIESVNDVLLFFKRTRFVLGGETYSLDSLEHEVMRPLGDARIHFAIVCSSISCPSLASEAFTAENLDALLRKQAEGFLADPTKNRLDRETKTFQLSKIFQWFSEDFTKEKGSVLNYIKDYLDPELQSFIEENAGKIRVEFLPYDWGLNGSWDGSPR